MRFERGYWLFIFCLLSLGLQTGLAYLTKGIRSDHSDPFARSIEVTLSPPPVVPAPRPAPPKPAPKPPVVKRDSPPPPRTARSADRVHVEARAPEPVRPRLVTRREAVAPAPARAKTVTAPVLPDSVRDERPTNIPSKTQTMPPNVRIAATTHRPVESGGSPAMAAHPTGRDGAAGPEAPKDDVAFTGGGRSRQAIPNGLIVTGGGGGKSILSVKDDNLLGSNLPDDKPGLGPGTGGGIGAGSGGGIGSATGKSVGLSATGRMALGSTRRRPGISVDSGIGAAPSGNQTGTNAPGGGRGRGAELPGTGGTGNGYGRGQGHGPGVGDDDPEPPSRARGVPFGNIAGLLGGGKPQAGGGPARGGVFGKRLGGGGEGVVHIVYALDISGSMRDGNKIGKAKEALKKALGELHPRDTFNIITFKKDVSTFRDDSVPANLVNVANAKAFIEDIRIGDGTNISAAVELALSMNGITEIFLMSDGEPNGGIQNFEELRKFIKEKNNRNVRITTLALGLGENFPGIRLLRGIAEDNAGTFDYVNLSK